MRLCVSRALVERSACSYVYRWVNVFAHSVPVYALVDGYIGVCVYVFMCLCVYAPVNVYVAVAVYIYVHISTCSSIHLSIHICARAEN